MYFEGHISEHFSDFSTIFQTITSNEYSDEQKEEMMQLFKAQTVEKHLSLISRFSKIKDDTGELSDLVWEVVEERGKGSFGCQEYFLKLFDVALEEVQENSNSNESKVLGESFNNHNSSIRLQHEHDQEGLKRKNDYLTEENKVLKEELDDKGNLVDTLAETNRNYSNLKTEFCRINEKCVFLSNDNNSLKIKVKEVHERLEVKESELRNRDIKLLKEIEELKELVAEKETLLKSFESDKELIYNDFELLSEEIVDRDLIIQTISEASDNHEENKSLVSENTLDQNVFDEDQNVSTIKRGQSNSCESCIKRRGSVYFSNFNTSHTGRRRGTPSPTFEDSFSMSEVEDFSSRRTKSLSDELMEVKFDMEEERTIKLREILGQLFLFEVDLRKRRQSLEKSIKVLQSQKKPKQKTNTMIRCRVTNGKMFKMQFTKYKGVRLPN
eukprot:GFUD01023190.1.p1 GENE.GFUD01023190.1~~GFUD01023190.1.p1  ORF type:complete len:441 (+),score=123.90 GFUD01023190.1:36-1358(+)